MPSTLVVVSKTELMRVKVINEAFMVHFKANLFSVHYDMVEPSRLAIGNC